MIAPASALDSRDQALPRLHYALRQGLLLVALLSWTPESAAQQPVQKILIDPSATLTASKRAGWLQQFEALEESAARTALPIQIEVRRGSTLIQAVQDRCGPLGTAYQAHLRQTFPGLNPDLASLHLLEREAPQDTPVLVPFCFEAPKLYSVKTRFQQDETVSSFFDQHLAAVRRTAVRDIDPFSIEAPVGVEVPPTGWGWRDFAGAQLGFSGYREVFKTLNPQISDLNKIYPGQPVTVPLLVNQPVTLGLEPGATTELSRIYYQRTGQRLSYLGASDGKLIAAVSSATLENLGEDCDSTVVAHSQQRPFDPILLTEILAENAALRRQYEHLGEAEKATILIADTGLNGFRIPPFDRRTVVVDDARGGELLLAADRDYADHNHGTSVSTLALGGEWFYSINLLLEPRIKLAFERAVVRRGPPHSPTFDFPPEALTRIAARASRHRIPIVNVSLQYTETELALFEQFYVDKSEILFVVAAGNDEKNLASSSGATYPARYGGERTRNVLTVAAATWGTRLAKFSNRNSHYVEIAAPGCAVATHELDGATQRYTDVSRSGTSFAAPLVSFAAGLIKRELPQLSAHEVKKRLLYSADSYVFDDEAVDFGRRLNVERAVAVYTDVVELSSGDSLRGKAVLDDGQGTVDLCDEVVLERGLLRTIVRRENHWDFEILHEDSVKVTQPPSRCRFLTNVVRVEDPFTGTARTEPMSAVRAIVFAIRPYYRNEHTHRSGG